MLKVRLIARSVTIILTLLLRSEDGIGMVRQGVASLKEKMKATPNPVDDFALKVAIEGLEEVLNIELD